MDADAVETKQSDEDEESVAVVSSLSFDPQSGMKPRLDAMLKEIEQKLPSLDDEDSDFEDFSGDEVEIFQRPSGYGQLVVEDADKDLDESLTSSDLSDRWPWKPVHNEKEDENVSHSGRAEDLHSWLNDSNRNVSEQGDNSNLESLMGNLNLSHISSSRVAWSDEVTPTTHHASPPLSPLSPTSAQSQTFSPRSIQSQTRSPRTQSTRQSRPSRRDLTRASQAAMKLSLGSLENIDFDIALQGVVEGEYQRRQRSRSSSFDLFDLRPGDNALSSKDPNKCTELMQGLVNLSIKTSGEKLDIDPMSGADRSNARSRRRQDRVLSKYEADMVSEKGAGATRTVSSGMSTTDSSIADYKVLAPRPRSERQGDKPVPLAREPRRDTICIDLRKSEQALADERNRQAVVQRVLKLHEKQDESSDSSSDSSTENDRDAWFEQRRRMRQAIERGDSVPSPIEKVKSHPARRVIQRPTRPIAMGSPTKAATSPSSAISTASAGSDCSTVSVEEGALPLDSPEKGTAAVGSNEEEERELMEEMKKLKIKAIEARKVIDAKLAIKEKFETMRPKNSVDNKRIAAQSTPAIYNLTMSHEPSLISLPLNVPERNDIIVLTVNLSSNEEMTQRAQSAVVMDKIDMWSGSYKALISWLCGLVPKDQEELEPEFKHIYPFHVVGMQQMVIEGNLVLAVAIAPTGLVDEKVLQALRLNVKTYKKDTVLFGRYVQKFLSLTNLSDVNPWLAELMSSPVKADTADAQYAYAAPTIQVSSKPMSTFVQVQTHPDCVQQYFGAEVGFFWQTINSEEQTHYADNELPQVKTDDSIETTIVLVSKQLYQSSTPVLTILSRMFAEGLEIAGLRLASLPFSYTGAAADGPVLAIAIRGTLAIHRWLQQMGPADPELARKVDSTCMMAHYGGSDRDHVTLYTPRTAQLIEEQLVRWFGGRLTANPELLKSGKVLAEIGQSSTASLDDSLGRTLPVALLSTTTTADCFVVASTILPVRFLGFLFGMSHSRGFRIRGVRRRHLTQRQVSALGISAEVARHYLSASDEKLCSKKKSRANSEIFNGSRGVCYCHHCVPRPVTILHLTKENISHHACMMLEAVTLHIIVRGLLEMCAEERNNCTLVRSNFLHFAPYSESLLNILGREFARVPENDSPASTSYIPPRLHSNAELEQISFLAFIGNAVLDSAFTYLCQLLAPPLDTESDELPDLFDTGLELLGIKWLPSLNTSQAREITPYEVGQREWKGSIKTLTGNPVLVAVFRGVDCTKRIKEVIYGDNKLLEQTSPALDRIVTNTPDLAYRLATLFFFDRELFADQESRPNTMYMAPIRIAAKSKVDTWEEDSFTVKSKRPRSGKGSKSSPRTPPPSVSHREEESIFKTMLMGPRPLVTLLIVKPGLVAKQKLSKILHLIMQDKFRVVAMRLAVLTELEATCLQTSAFRKSEELHKLDLEHMTSGPSLLLALHRENAIKKLEDVLGPEDPKLAKTTSPYCLRGVYGTDLTNNGFYCSRSYPSSVSDIKQFFPDGLCCTETIDLTAEEILAPGVDSKLSATSRVARERTVLDPGPYNLNRLNEVNCLVLLPPLVRLEAKNAKFADVIQFLQTSEVSIVGARMVWFTEEQAQQYLHVIKAGSFAQVPVLTSAPIMVLAVQCQNAVLSFDYIMEEGMRKIGRSVEDYKMYIRCAKDMEMAKRLLTFFFDELLGNDCKIEICPKTENGADAVTESTGS